MPRIRHPHTHRPLGPREPSTPPARKATAAAPLVYIPPAGFPADPREFLAYLQAGQFTDEQVRYLRSNALRIYESALASARGNPDLVAEVALGDEIAAAWRAALAALPPASAANPFGG
jgi:hypothetical protein